jgi:hypothetical protein
LKGSMGGVGVVLFTCESEWELFNDGIQILIDRIL